MLAFYLAQPPSARANIHPTTSTHMQRPRSGTTGSTTSDRSSCADISDNQRELPNASLIRQASAWFVKAQQIDPEDEVALAFIRIVGAVFDFCETARLICDRLMIRR